MLINKCISLYLTVWMSSLGSKIIALDLKIIDTFNKNVFPGLGD
jgi:hypothetical protein